MLEEPYTDGNLMDWRCPNCGENHRDIEVWENLKQDTIEIEQTCGNCGKTYQIRVEGHYEWEPHSFKITERQK